MDIVQGLNPWPFLALQLAPSTYILGFTVPSSILRPAILPIQVTCPYIVCINLKNFIPRLGWAATIACISTMFALSFLEMAILSKWSFETQGPAPKKSKSTSQNGKGKDSKITKKKDTTWNRLKFGFGSLMSFRDLNTPHETKNCPHFSSDPSYTPSYSKFLLTTLPKFVLCCLLLDVIESQPPPPDAPALFASSEIPLFRRLGEIGGEDVALRVGASLGFWMVLYCMLSCMSFFLGLICVGLGAEVKEWRPLMGPFSEAYTVRGFWGFVSIHSILTLARKLPLSRSNFLRYIRLVVQCSRREGQADPQPSKFWHQGTRKTFSNPSIFLVDNFPIPLPSLVSRYAKIFLTFYISGLVHVIGDYIFMPWSESWTVQFFIAQAVGIMLEDFVQWVWRTSIERKKGGETKTWKKVVGFVWVAVFMLVWSTPAWFFPNAGKNTGAKEGKLLPFSVIGYFVDR
ncbi:uncharacterized protein PAC_13170 [Phialocephala subalpina]|uniref:Wax synthase domain-containing protein n=1 Tax=Phialocephala subalpina TaxID=576137 RepID=A0A1L7XE33_9HELO|nr:uncharacterized protein PAC_13170 [Phialocephala subalpina]